MKGLIRMIQIKPVDEDNWRDVIDIKVKDEQTRFIESTSESLLEAAYDISLKWHPFGIYSNNNCIGFAMIGAYDPKEKYIWLDRFMLGENHQGKGLGSKSLDEVVHMIQRKWDVKEIVLSVTPDNEPAIAFYKKYGFDWLKKTDPENGEQLMRLKV